MFRIFLLLYCGKIRIRNGKPDHHPEEKEYSVVIENKVCQPLKKKCENSGEESHAHHLFLYGGAAAQIGEATRRKEKHEYEKEYEREYAHFRRELEIQAVAVICHLGTAYGITGINRGKSLLAYSDAGYQISRYLLRK